MKARAGKGQITNVDHILIPSRVLKTLVEATLNLVMPSMKVEIMGDMQNAGIELYDNIAYYSFSQIRDYFHLIFGSSGAEVLTDILRNTLQHSRQFEKYG